MFKPKNWVVLLATVTLGLPLWPGDTLQKEAWQIVTDAMRAGGEDAATALGMLPTIDDPTSRTLVGTALKGKDGTAIASISAGLSPAQCRSYLADLGTAAQDPGVGPKIPILDAIARAGTGEAAEILSRIADGDVGPTAGVAFGLLERMGTLAEPLFLRTATNGKTAWARETALSVLRRMRDTSAVVAFRSALHDSNEGVRTAGALGLAQLGHQDGRQQLETAARDSGSGYQMDALVALAIMGRPGGLDRLRELVTSPDEALRGRAVWAIARSGNMSLKEFSYRLGLDRQPVFRSMLAEKLLDPNDPKDRSVLQEIITKGDDTSQVVAAQRLLQSGVSASAEAAIARALTSQSDEVRHLALKVAAVQPALRPALAEQLASADPAVQIAAMSAISDLRQRDRFIAVAPYVASKVRGVSAAAARTLALLDPTAAEQVFQEGLTSNSAHVRIHSAAMLLAVAARSK